VIAALQAWLNDPAIATVVLGAVVGMAATLLGVFLVLRKSAMLTDAISHSVLFGIVVGFLVVGDLHHPLLTVGAALAGLVTVAGTRALEASGRVRTDAAIGLVFPLLFAVAVLLAGRYAGDAHLDADAVLVGEIGFAWIDVVPAWGLEMPRALRTMLVVLALDAVLVAALWKELKVGAFDPAFAAAIGLAPGAVATALLAATSLTAVAAFDAVGAVLFVAFVVAPPAAGLLLAARVGTVLAVGLVVSVASALGGYAAALAFDLAIAPAMALAAGAFVALALLVGPRHGLLARLARAQVRGLDLDARALLVHLATHEGAALGARENTRPALREHLGWRPRKVDRVIRHALDGGFVERGRGREGLRPTGRGRAWIDEVVPDPGAPPRRRG
jgi:manganese/zinc/iron transport system permease protein